MLYWKPTVTDNMAQEILSKMTDNMKRRGSMSKRLTKNYSKNDFYEVHNNPRSGGGCSRVSTK